MRAVGIDFGSKRVGVAVSDATGTLASPHSVIQRSRSHAEDHRKIAAVVDEYEAAVVVVGHPLSLDGSKGPAARLVEAEVEWRADAPATARLRPEHALLGTLLERIFDQVGRPPGEAGSIEDAAWVGWRLLEMLPMPEERRMALLAVDDPHSRLDGLLELIG